MIARRWFPSPTLLFTLAALTVCAELRAQRPIDEAAIQRALRHATPEWQLVGPHMPDPVTGSVAALELAADVLRARRMPEDALDYYGYALARGGDEAKLRNRIGVTQLELHHPELARISFKRVLLLKRKDAEGWNNLGATEYVVGNIRGAIENYKRAVKLNRKAAVFHSNLGTAYFDTKDYDSARVQFTAALKLDREVFLHGGWAGIQAHVLTPQDRGRFCFEMAKLAAREGDEENVLRWLTRSSETGFDVRYEMNGDKDFANYRKDARVDLLIRNAKAMRSGQLASAAPAPTLAADPAKTP